MIKHIVLFKFKEIQNKSERLAQIKRDLEALPQTISELQHITIGINVNPAEKWDLSLEAVVKDMHDLAAYAGHPAHQAIVRKQIAPILESRACVDHNQI